MLASLRGDEDKAFGVEIELPVEPVQPPLQDVRAILFDGMAGLFFLVIPRRRKNRQSDDEEP